MRLRQSPTLRLAKPRAAVQSPPLRGRCPAGQRGARRARHSKPCASCGAIPLTDCRFAVPIALPFGQVEAVPLIEFVDQADALGAAEIRLAPQRTLLLLCPSRRFGRRRPRRRRATPASSSMPPTRAARIVACPGSPACASGHIPARAIAARDRRARAGPRPRLRSARLRLRASAAPSPAMTG